jgi:zinc transport system substrate-binding protein
LAVEQARVIKEELEKLIPASSELIEANFNALVADLRSLDEALESTFAKSSGLWIASHSAFSYLARRYSLELQIVHWEPNEFPSDDQWQELEELVASRPASWMLWEDEPMQETFDRLRTLGVRVAVFSPAATRPKSGDYLTTMRNNLERLQATVPTSS